MTIHARILAYVETVPPDDAYSKLQASLSSGTPYDIGTLAFAGLAFAPKTDAWWGGRWGAGRWRAWAGC